MTIAMWWRENLRHPVLLVLMWGQALLLPMPIFSQTATDTPFPDTPDNPPVDLLRTYVLEDGRSCEVTLEYDPSQPPGQPCRHILEMSGGGWFDLTFRCTDFYFPDDSLTIPYHPEPSAPVHLQLHIYGINTAIEETDLPFFLHEEEVGYSLSVIPDSAQTTFRLPAGRYFLEYLGLESENDFCQKKSVLSVGIDAVNPFPAPKDTITGTSQGFNIIETFTAMDDNGTTGIRTRTYFDDWGREEQQVGTGQTPLGNDLVSMNEYDPFGRQVRTWLPVSVTGNNGGYVSPASFASVSAVSTSDIHTYTQRSYEESPLSRPLSTIGAGQAWHSAGRGTATSYHTNTAAGDSLSCHLLRVTDTGEASLSITEDGYYPAGTLQVTRSSDEDGRVMFEFKDRQDRMVLIRRSNTTADNRFLDTYYVYDGFDRLRAVLPPVASEDIVGGSVSPSVVDAYAYLYQYDHRHRVTAKKLPGTAWTRYCYDEADLPVFVQDGRQRDAGVMTFMLYDSFGRETVRGTCKESPEMLRNQLEGKYARTLCTEDGSGYILPTDIPLQEMQIHQFLYYDNYAFSDSLGFSMPERESYSHHYAMPYGEGLLTGSSIALVGKDGAVANEKMLRSRIIYDELTRLPVHSISENAKGGIDVVTTAYSYTGKPVRVRQTHITPADTLTAEYTYTYDHAERLTGTQLSLNGAEPVTIAANTYDELGRLQSVSRMENPQLLTQYAYNVRSWTTAISSPLFSQQLYYNESHNGSTPQWGGNISAMDWQAAGETQGTNAANGRQRGYTFAYDGLSRLTQADYHEDNQRSNHYDTHYTYDLMGNITALQRSGLHDDGAYSLIDDLAFGYEGNRIVKVTDGVMDGPYRKDAWHYRDRVDADIEREYDGNGNLVKDLDAGILRIEYNSLNLPQMIKFSDHSKHVYAYDATGRKLRAEYHTPIMVVTEPQVPDMGEEMPEQEDVLMEEQQQEWNEEEWGEEWEMEEEELIPAEMPDENGEVVEEPLPQEENNCKPTIFFEDDDIACEVTTVDYCGDFIYVNSKLKRMLFPGGYVTFRNDSIEHPEYHFYLTDHQGNVRVVANQNGEVEQVNHYYPYGGLMGESTSSDHQPYKYNGKELDRHHGLDWFDYGARWFNGYSWMTPDPLAEKYREVSPYMYCLGNPIKYIDPDGREIWIHYINADGNSESFLYSPGMTCTTDNSAAKAIVYNLNDMYSNQDGAIVLDAIIRSSTKYGIKQADTHSESGEGYFYTATNIMSINDVNNTLTFAEEVFHIYQHVNNQGGTTAVNEVEAKLFSAKMNLEIDAWYISNNASYAKKIAGIQDSIYPDNMNKLLYFGYNEELYRSAVNSFFDGSLGGPIYRRLGYSRGEIKQNPLIKNFLPAK